MELEAFCEELENRDDYEWAETTNDKGTRCIAVKNTRFDTVTLFTLDAIKEHDWAFLENQTFHGKNVEHMTRVTGYFSKVSGWNKGKTGELKDRHRNVV